MMQTLKLLGVPITGHAFHADFPDPQFNRGGYFDLPFAETEDGIKHHRYAGSAVKLFPTQLSRTPKENVARMIICVRNRDKALDSMMRMWDAGGPICGIVANRDVANSAYNVLYTILSELDIEPRMTVRYEDMFTIPKRIVPEIATFIGRPESDCGPAIENIKPGRSSCQ